MATAAAYLQPRDAARGALDCCDAGAAVAIGAKALLTLALAHPVILAITAAVILTDLPMPAIAPFTTQQGIKVKVVQLDKIPTQYRERREYRSDDEDSRCEIVLRYNRIA
jgi:hypothetical protein